MRGQRAFLIAFSVAIITFAIPVALLGVRLVALGEITLVAGARPDATLHGQLFADRAVFKLHATVARRPDVLVLGSSRVGAFRAEMFSGLEGRPDRFYNATGAMTSLRKGLEFLRLVPADGWPEVILLGIDIWHLNPNTERARAQEVEPLERGSTAQVEYVTAVLRSTAELAVTDPAVRDVLLGRTAIPRDVAGLGAILSGTGDRPDGSTLRSDDAWRSALARPDADRSAAYLRLVAIGGFEYEPFEQADESALDDLRSILDLAELRSARVVVFTPPFGTSLISAMRSQPHFAAGIADAERRLAALLRERGVAHRVALDLGSYGCADDEHIDGVHVSEVCGARILASLLEQPDAAFALAGYADRAHLEQLVAGRGSSYLLDRR